MAIYHKFERNAEQTDFLSLADAALHWFWRHWRGITLGLAFIILGSAGWYGWQSWQQRGNLAASAAYYAASRPDQPNLEALAQVAADFPHSPFAAIARLDLAARSLSIGDLAGARTQLSPLLKPSKLPPPLQAAAQEWEGYLLEAEGQWAPAAAAFRRILTMPGADQGSALHNTVRCLAQVGDQKAIAELIESRPDPFTTDTAQTQAKELERLWFAISSAAH